MNLPTRWEELPEVIRKRFGQKRAGRQRAMVADGHLLLVLHKMPKPGMKTREAAFFWRKPTGEWESTEKGQGLFTLRQHVEEFSAAEERLSNTYAKAQNAEAYFRILQEVAPLHHASKNLHATLQAAREGISEDRDIIDLRDQAYELERTLDLLVQDTKNALELHIAKKSEELGRISKRTVQSANRLNILAAIFFPLTAIASIFGMNLQSGFDNAPLWVFWLIFIGGLMLGFITRAWVVKSEKEED